MAEGEKSGMKENETRAEKDTLEVRRGCCKKY